MRKAIIDAQGLVLNIIEIEPDSTWSAPTGITLIDAGDGSPDDTWDGTQFIKPEPILPEPPKSTHLAKITGFDVVAIKPLSVIRTWNGSDYPYDCFVTQTLKDEYIAEKVIIGDYVLVHFDDKNRALAMLKVFNTW